MNKRHRLLSGALFMAVALGSCSTAPTPSRRISVQAEEPQLEAFVRSLDTVSTLEATNEIELASQAGGRVQQVLVHDGDRVAAGELLVVLDQTQLRADVAALEAKAAVDAISYQRYRGLVEQGAATALLRDEAQAKAIGSEQALKAKQADLAYKDVRAPISGLLGDLSIKAGDVVQAGTPFGRIIRNENLQARINVPANRSNAVAAGQLVQLLDGTGNRPLAEGRIERIDPEVNTASQTMLAQAAINNSNGQLRNGQRLRTRVILGAERKLAVPFTAVKRQFGQSFVFVVGSVADLERDPGQADLKALRKLPPNSLVALQRAVTLGPLQGSVYPVISGLNSGDRMIVRGNLGLRHGSVIELTP